MESRTDLIVQYIQSKKPLIDNTEKGSIEINFSGSKIAPSHKIFDEITTQHASR